jgi:Cu(I)/Ag(I) efflux system membrane fusion protein
MEARSMKSMKNMKSMKTIIKIIGNRYVQLGLVAIVGLFIGWLFFHSTGKVEEKKELITRDNPSAVWTCSMHPQIRMPAPGKCPICGMDLIPLIHSNVSVDPEAIQFTPEAAQLANVLTSVVTSQKPVKEVRLYGKVQADERLLQSQVAHIPGRIEQLMVNFTGETVKKGQTLAVIYSPELVTAQQELLEAAKTKDTQPGIYEAAREKLQLWKLTDSQISNMKAQGASRPNSRLFQILPGL